MHAAITYEVIIMLYVTWLIVWRKWYGLYIRCALVGLYLRNIMRQIILSNVLSIIYQDLVMKENQQI